ncbi:MAG: hypothetical protein FK734_15920 [Asgard group archaeon]|nr:hypothetical protein [Asgard group archaeon]
MIGKDLDVTPMEAFFLMVLKTKKSQSGSEIVEQIQKNLGTSWAPSPGATYKILQSLEKKDLIKETTQKENREDKRIRTYDLTQKGLETLPVITKRILKIALFADSCCADLCVDNSNDIKIIRVYNSKD